MKEKTSHLKKIDGVSWIASYPKSGNTWVRCFLDYYFLGRLDINKLAVAVSDSQESLYYPVSPAPLSNLAFSHFAMLRPAAVLGALARWPHNAFPCFIKTHWQHRKSLDPITFQSFYLIRDPRDVAVSLARHSNLNIDLAIKVMADPLMRWEKNEVFSEVGSWSDHVKSWESKALVIKYEDLQGCLPAIVEGYSGAASVEDAIEACKIERLREAERKHGFKEALNGTFFGPAKNGGWKDVLSQAQADAIVADHNEIMDRYGYL